MADGRVSVLLGDPGFQAASIFWLHHGNMEQPCLLLSGTETWEYTNGFCLMIYCQTIQFFPSVKQKEKDKMWMSTCSFFHKLSIVGTQKINHFNVSKQFSSFLGGVPEEIKFTLNSSNFSSAYYNDKFYQIQGYIWLSKDHVNISRKKTPFFI